MPEHPRMHVVANGKPVTVVDRATVADLVLTLGLQDRAVVVERNGQAVARSSFADVRLSDGDRLEVVKAVPGG